MNVLLKISNVIECEIIKRINRFTVSVNINGKRENVHINNTGKLEQWIVKGNKGFCYRINGKKLKYRLFAINNGEKTAVIDTNLHMRCFEELIRRKIIFNGCKIIKRNPKIENTIFDYLLDCGIIEIKSSTLYQKEISEYPDTYTKRGERQIEILGKLKESGKNVFVVVISGVSGVKYFRINENYGKKIREFIMRYKIDLIPILVEFIKPDKIIFGSFLRFIDLTNTCKYTISNRKLII